MARVELPIRPLMYPMPVVLVGSILDGRVNYMTAAYCNIINHRPPMLYVSLTKSHFTTQAILKECKFSINIPTEEILTAVDYCGIASGARTDKSTVFHTFFGKTGAPMAEECSVNLECLLADVLDYGGNDKIFVGHINGIYAQEEYLTDGIPDMEKTGPICLDNGSNRYFKNGKYISKAYHIGKMHPQPEE